MPFGPAIGVTSGTPNVARITAFPLSGVMRNVVVVLFPPWISVTHPFGVAAMNCSPPRIGVVPVAPVVRSSCQTACRWKPPSTMAAAIVEPLMGLRRLASAVEQCRHDAVEDVGLGRHELVVAKLCHHGAENKGTADEHVCPIPLHPAPLATSLEADGGEL